MEDIGDATWGEVCHTCCCHTSTEWGCIFVGVFFLLMCLYFFLLSLELLGESAKVLGGCTAGSLLGDNTNPVASVIIGLVSTALVQSSSTTTSIVVSLVGAGSIATEQAIYMVMGANIGTTITNTIVALGQMGDGDQLERAFAGATVNDMFNCLTVGVLFFVELIFHYLERLTWAMVKNATISDGESWEGPVKKIVSPLGSKIILANKKVIEGVAQGEKSCDDFYPTSCEGSPSYDTCSFGLIACNKDTGDCPVFFQPGASQKDDEISGGVCFFIAIVMLIICLLGLVSILQKLLMGMSTRIFYKTTNINGYLAILIGCGITVLVQSSSITTSALTPLVGLGVIHLEQMFPLTLGANIGTTVPALMASLVSDKIDSLQVALAHLFFNVTGVAIWYPLPFMRRVPLSLARALGKGTRLWRVFPFVYIFSAFFILPLILLGLSACFEAGSKGFTALGVVLVLLIALGTIYFVYWFRYKGGRDCCVRCMGNRQARRVTLRTLPEDMQYLKAIVVALADHTGLPEDDEEDEDFETGEDEPFVAEKKSDAQTLVDSSEEEVMVSDVHLENGA